MMLVCLNDSTASLQTVIPSTTIEFIPCLSHVLQLALGDMLSMIKIDPKNDKIITNWNDVMIHSEATGIPLTLHKVTAPMCPCTYPLILFFGRSKA